MPLIGKMLGTYQILELLGAGGMGEVWHARDIELEREVAIKVVPKELAGDSMVLERFRREARMLAAVHHPNIATIYGVEESGGVRFIVMELIEGESLADRMSAGAIPLENALRYGIEIAGALHEAHRAGVVHRDLKPGNVMLTRRGLKLLDFGLAKPASLLTNVLGEDTPTAAAAEDPITHAGSILGTTQYMSPEQLQGTEADSRADIFALGCVLYEMITGNRPFVGASQASLISAIMTAEPPAVSELRPASPAFLDHLIQRCLAKDPDARWHSALDLASQLEWIADTDWPSANETPPAAKPQRPPVIDEPRDARSQQRDSRGGSYRIEYFQSADGASIAAARGGSGRPLFIVPSMTSSIESSWPAYADAFRDYELITYDRRGTGLSERGSAPQAAESYLADAQAVVEGFGLDDFDVIGTLMGTIEAASLASRNLERVGHLVLRSPVMGLGDWASIPAVSAALAAMDRDWEFFTESFSQMVVGWGNPNGPDMAARFRAVTSRDELRAIIDAYTELDLSVVYPEIQATTLVERHPGYFFPDTYFRRIASLIGDCQVAVFSGPAAEFMNDFSIAQAFLAAQRSEDDST